jgi:hypothetical protein
VIGRCRDCSISNNFVGYSEFEDGIVFHQTSEHSTQAAYRIMIQGNRCIGNARSGIHIGANMHEIFLANNLCVNNGFNLVMNGDNCTSTGDVAIGWNDRTYPLARQRPNVLIAGRRISISNLTVLDSYRVAVGVSGEDIAISGGLIRNAEPGGSGANTVGIAISPCSAVDEFLYPATGLLPRIVHRQAKVFADKVRISDMRIRGFESAIQVDKAFRRLKLQDNPDIEYVANQIYEEMKLDDCEGRDSQCRQVCLRDNDLHENKRPLQNVNVAWEGIQLRDNAGLDS